MPVAHSHPHSPSLPEYSNATTAPPTKVRRNLFSTHLSRRPASSQQSSQLAETFVPPPSPKRSPEQCSSHSPTHTRSHNSSDGIIALHPNGRPMLPILPRLPAHLRLSTTSDDEQHPYDLDDEAERNNSPTRYNHPTLPDTNDEEERARIERTLVDMMYQQRQRANPGGSGTSPRALRNVISVAAEPECKTREEEELLNLIMASLRDKVAVLDSEAWMYGEKVEETQAQI